MKNLDLIAARTAQDIIKRTEEQKQDASAVDNLLTKSLGVLQENGVYAVLLYLYSRSNSTEKPIAESTRLKLFGLITELELHVPVPEQPVVSVALKFLTDNVCNELDRLLLVKQLWEQTLIYARYGAKARNATTGSE
jgi:hypothetical protein